MEAQAHQFNSIGYITSKLTDKQLAPIWKEVNKIKNDFEKANPYNHELAGNIEHEYALKDCVQYTHDLIMPFVGSMDNIFKHIKDYRILNKSCPYMLESLWVNYQKKHEFNPMHCHSGIYSFVIWLKAPFKIEDEIARVESRNARAKCPAHFQFTYTDSLGQIRQEIIPVDHTYENVLCIFPAKLNHQVYPFYTSDDYRISISGNICLKVDN